MSNLQLFRSEMETKGGARDVRAYGIDLGTTNSTVAEASWIPGEKPVCRVLEIDQPLCPAGTMTSPLVPSVVAVLDSDGPMVGEGAKRLRTRPQDANLFPERTLFYETKNDIGLRKTYHRAPESFNHASKIAGHILRFLKDAALQEGQGKPVHFCVTVPASWTIATETDTAYKTGKYVRGTALLILRKRKETLRGDRSDIYPDVQAEVQRQLKTMLDIDDKDDPNFGDSDYQLAAYAAALRVVAAYSAIEDIDVERELRRVRKAGESSPLTDMIKSAVRIASDFLVPDGLESVVWKRLLPEERFYIKGVEIEAHGEYRDGVYQEFARGFGIRDYRGLLGSGAANQTRLKTPGELKGRDLSGEGFAGSILRQILFAVYKTAEEDDPRPGLDYLKQEVPHYWDRRQTIIALLNYLSQKPSTAMTHWKKDAEAAHLLQGAVEGDGV